MKQYKIALDGPGGAGKSTVAREIAKQLGIVYVDTGAMYRTVGLFIKERGIDPADTTAVIEALSDISLSYAVKDGSQTILLCGREVGDEIRTPEISMYASRVSAIPEVRTYLLSAQRSIAEQNSVIMDGRDIGTVIFPDAEVKIFLTASPEARAKRRYLELQAKGKEVAYEDVLREMNERDKNDSERAVAPLKPAEDAIILDTSPMSFEESVEAVLKTVRERLAQESKPKKKNKSTPYMRLYKVAARFIRFCLRIRIIGKENVPKEGGYVVCANHISLIDVFTLGASFPRQLHYLGKKELFRVPILAPIIRALGAIPLDRGGSDVGAIKTSIAVAKRGDLISVFPQGHRHKGKNPADTDIKNGVGLIAYRAGVGMIPVCIKIKRQKYCLFRRIEVIIGKPLSREELGFDKGGNEEYTNASRIVFGKICELGGYTPAADEKGAENA